MEKDMCKYVDVLSSSDIAILERIISHQYKKFIHFYRLVEVYSESISNLKYNFRGASSLDVSLVFSSKKGLEAIASTLRSKMEEEGYEGDAKVDKKTILISIRMDEDW